MYRDPWPDLASMFPDACPRCAGMGSALRWDDVGRVYTMECECKQNGESVTNTTWEPVKTLAEIEGEWEFIYSAETPHERSRLIDVQLPDGYAVCQRVEPEAITPLALQLEGWKPIFHDGVPVLYTLTIKEEGGVTTEVNWETAKNRVEVGRESKDEYDVTVFPGVKTMADLRTLVRFLSGGAE